MGASLGTTVDIVMHAETKRHRPRVQGNPAVEKVMRESLHAEEYFQRRRAEPQEPQRAKIATALLRAELKKTEGDLKNARNGDARCSVRDRDADSPEDVHP